MGEQAISIARDINPADLLAIMRQGYRVFYQRENNVWGVQNGYGQTVTELVPQTAAIVINSLYVVRMFRDGPLTVWCHAPDAVG